MVNFQYAEYFLILFNMKVDSTIVYIRYVNFCLINLIGNIKPFFIQYTETRSYKLKFYIFGGLI